MVDTEKLITGANLAIDTFSKRLIEDVTLYRQLTQVNTDELQKALHLHMSVLFSLLELTTIEKAMLATSLAYAKRYHYKNLVANTSECYKMLYHFNNCRKKSIWTRIGKVVQQAEDKQLSISYNQITDALYEFGEHKINQELRDMTVHYAEKMLTVYQVTVDLKSEDEAVRYFCKFYDILQSMLSFANELVGRFMYEENSSEGSLIITTSLIGNQKHQAFMKLIYSRETLTDILLSVIPKGSQELDEMAHQEARIGKISEYITQQSYFNGDNTFSSIIKFYETQLLLRFMMLDIAANIEACCNSSSSIEAALNARRFIIPQVSMLALLYGYSEDERSHSCWQFMIEQMPESMSDKRKCIEDYVENLLMIIPKSKRHAAVHVYDDKGSNLVPRFIDMLEKMNFVEEFASIKIISDFYSQFMQFMVELTTYLADQAHTETVENTRRFHEKIDWFVDIVNKSQLPDEQKQRIIEQMNKIKEIL